MKGQKYVLSALRVGHPLAWGRGVVVSQHRAVLWDKIGPGEHSCHWCGCRLVWAPTKLPLPSGISRLIVDHLDNDRQNNDPANLVPACSACNTLRSTPNAGRRRKPYVFSTKRSDPYAEPKALPSEMGPYRVVLSEASERVAGGYRWLYVLSCGHSVARRGNGRTLCHCEKCSSGEAIDLSLLRAAARSLREDRDAGRSFDAGRLKAIEREIARYEGRWPVKESKPRRPYAKQRPRPAPRERPAITWARFAGMVARRAPGQDPLNASPRVVVAFLRERQADGVRGVALLEEANVIGLKLREAFPERWSSGTPPEIAAELWAAR